MRILLVADTHIGFDMPRKPKVERRRRGPDFLTNFRRALEPALNGVELRSQLSALPSDAGVRVNFNGPWTNEAQRILTAANLRGLGPPTMNVSLRGWGDARTLERTALSARSRRGRRSP